MLNRETTMMTISLFEYLERTWSITSHPFTFGIIKSSSITSGLNESISSMASFPPLAVFTSMSKSFIISEMVSIFSEISSTISTLFFSIFHWSVLCWFFPILKI
ncbi:Uncharacterised protein [Segatella copri]|nr:Uncharacterised protein [Segatella copri]